MIEGKKILITGGSGFIGSATAKLLGERNEVEILDTTYNPDFKTYKLDIIDVDEETVWGATEAIYKADIIFHMAARLGVKEVVDDVISTLETNIVGTSNILHTASHAHRDGFLKRVVSFSTSEIYGSYAYNVGENDGAGYDDVLDRRWCYAVSKLAAEQLAFGYYRQHGLPVVVVRPFNIFGAGRGNDHAVTNFIKAALKNQDLIINGKGTQIRSWCYVDDFCDGAIKCADNEQAIGRAFNIGNPKNTVTVYELAQTIKELCGSRSKIIFEPNKYTDVNIRIPDINLAQKVLKYKPKISLIEGLNKTIDWVNANAV